jgi:FAD:protein FMN transferase
MISRRLFLALPLAPSLRSLARGLPTDAHHFQNDHVLGTSLDLTVWSKTVEEAVRVERALADEIGRLAMMLDTRDPRSEISRIGQRAVRPSLDVADMFAVYAEWHVRTGGVLSLRPEGPGAPMDVGALGKAFIIDRAATAGRRAGPGIEGLLLNVGGDIVTWGRDCEVGVASPGMPSDTLPSVNLVRLRDAAVATSGPSLRGAHLIDARTGRKPHSPASATVIAGDLVTATALATTLCVVDADAGLALVGRTPGAEALRVGADGTERRSSSFRGIERG